MFKDEYAGICAHCFNPVLQGQEYRFQERGRTFHLDCVRAYPNSYYVKQERRTAIKEQKDAKSVRIK